MNPARFADNLSGLSQVVNGHFTDEHLRRAVAGTNLPADDNTAVICEKAIQSIKEKPGNRFHLVKVAAKAYSEVMTNGRSRFDG